MGRTTHDLELDHHGVLSDAQIASGAPATGQAPLSNGDGTRTWGDVSASGGAVDLVTGDSATFDASTGSWSNSGGTMVHDTTYGTIWNALGSVGTLKFTTSVWSEYIELALSGTFKAAKRYTIVLALFTEEAGSTPWQAWLGEIGTDSATSTFSTDTEAAWPNTYRPYAFSWTPSADRTSAVVRINQTGSSTLNLHVGLCLVREHDNMFDPDMFLISGSNQTEGFVPVVMRPYYNTLSLSMAPGNFPGTINPGLTINKDGDSHVVGPYDSNGDNPRIALTSYGMWLYTPNGAASDLPYSGLEIDVGPDYVGLYISEKDADTIQIYPDVSGGYDVEFVEVGTSHRHFKFVEVAGGVAVPALGMLPQYSSPPHVGTETEGESYYNPVDHESYTWNGSAWMPWWPST